MEGGAEAALPRCEERLPSMDVWMQKEKDGIR